MEISIISLESRKGASLGETKKVRRGYARYLIQSKKALRYDKADLEQFSKLRVSLEKQEAEKLQTAQALAEKLTETPIQLHSRAADESRLYGSIGSKEIAEAIMQAGLSVEKKHIHLPAGPIRQLGEHEVVLHLHDQVTAKITIQVSPTTS